MQSLFNYLNIDTDFSLLTSYISSFSLNYFVLFADILDTAAPQLLNFIGYSAAKNPQTLITNRVLAELIIDNSTISFFKNSGLSQPSEIDDRFIANILSLQKASKSIFFALEPVATVTNLSFNYISAILTLFYLVLVFFFFFILFFTLFCPIPQQLFSSDLFLFTIDSTYGLVESEKEVGTLTDILLPLFFVLSVSVGWFFLLLPYQVVNVLSSYTDSLIILFFCCLIISLPVNLLYECGFFFSTFFRGSAGSTSTLMELVYDLIANTTMFARMQVQHVRVLLGLAMYIETATFVESLSLNQLLDTPQFYNYFSWNKTTEHFTSSGLTFVKDLILQIATLIGELGHYIVFLLQSSASYAALIFWLFSLLYSGFFKDCLEMYFAYRNL